ncbi:hypothetical protein OPT61_g1714 [Boeremia exigua]|uniref:Uncharacterized protein n=1 Tax=Boeremia exigua TaxID=749465 RepID=A0ACC2IPH3_9PLEO|nr:hypothetical protein OPT61_g1714 [Boeremia exigua]
MFKLAKSLFRRQPWPQLRFPTTGFEVVSDTALFEEEQLEEFHRGVYYPVNIGDVFASKYQIVGKLGFGVTDHAYITLKVFTRDGMDKNEYKVYDILSKGNASHPGYNHVRKAFGLFTIPRHGGDHRCLVQKPMWDSFKDLLNRNPAHRFTDELLKAGLSQLLLALDYLHTEADIIHTDIKADNILIEIEDQNILKAFVDAEMTCPSPRKVVDGKSIYATRQFELPKEYGPVVLGDFGSAVRGDKPQIHDAQPDVYRCPEVMLETAWSYPADIWNVGAMIWDLYEDKHLFHGIDPIKKRYLTRAHLAELVAILGPPPIDMLERGARSKEFFDGQGNWIAKIDIPQGLTLESLEENLDGEKKEEFLQFASLKLDAWSEALAARLELCLPRIKIQGVFSVTYGFIGADKAPENASESDVFTYKAQRWLWNESDQPKRRYLKFDLNALVKVAENTMGSDVSCVEVTKLPEENFNKTFLLTMHDGHQLIARLPNPNAGPARYTTASEVATMDYVRDRLQIPVPKIISYNTQAETNDVGAEYILMEKCPGIELGRLWDDLSARQKVDIVRQLATFSARLSKARFAYYGSLYYTKDIPDAIDTRIDDTFSVGPTTSRTWFDDGRGEVDIYRGPWTSAEDVLTAIANRENACLDRLLDFPRDRQQGIFNNPGGYQPFKDTKSAVIRDYSCVLPYIMPQDDAYTASILWHNDLHSDNIFVNEDRPTEITGIIDWQNVHLSPAFLHMHHPSLIEYDGPILNNFEKPVLPSGFAELAPDEKDKARALHTAQSIWGLYEIFIQKQAPDLLRVLRYRNTLSCQVMNLVGSIFDDGEAYVQTLLSQLAKPETWEDVIKANGHDAASVPCPLKYSDEDVKKQEDAMIKWEKDVERKARVISEVGAYTGWDGAVPPEDFDKVFEKLNEAKERFLDTEARSPQEREQWAQAWPFRDSKETTC